jgi:hypothetical protein
LVAWWPYLAALQGKVHPGIMAKRDFFCGYFFKARFFGVLLNAALVAWFG